MPCLASPIRIDRRRFVAGGAVAFDSIVAALPRAGSAQSGDRATFVVAGLDTRSPVEPENTDVLILARVDYEAGTVRALSIPRDLYVLVPGFGPDKICRAYDHGIRAEPDRDWKAGVSSLAGTIVRNFGVEVDGTAVTDFNGFPQVIDALGGIEVDNPYDVYNLDRTEVVFPAGWITLDGDAALEFSRTRHQDGDAGRVDRQQLVLAAMPEKLQDPAIRENLPEILATVSDAIRTDVSLRGQLRLLDLARGISGDDVVFGTITEFLTEETLPSGMWVYRADWETLPAYVQSWLDGEG